MMGHHLSTNTLKEMTKSIVIFCAFLFPLSLFELCLLIACRRELYLLHILPSLLVILL